MPTIKNNSLIQIGGLEKGQCGMKAKANSAHNCCGAPTLQSPSSLPPKPQLGQKLPYRYLKLNTSMSDVFLATFL